MEVRFLGAAQTVTGSMHLVSTAHARVLLDCGLFQGRRHEANERNRNLPVDPTGLDAVVLSHAHIDHSGALPLLVKRGYGGPVYATPATRDLCAAMLEDAALIQNCFYLVRARARRSAVFERTNLSGGSRHATSRRGERTEHPSLVRSSRHAQCFVP